MSKLAEPVTDGRRQRSERSQAAIVRACVELMEEGVLAPTAQEIAERAGVGIRSFFRHFVDMDSLFDTVDRQMRQEYEALFTKGSRDGSLDERIGEMVTVFAAGWERVTNTVLATMAMRWRSEALRRNWIRNLRGLQKIIDAWLPELKALSREDREAVYAIMSFEFWYRLHREQGLGKAPTRRILKRLISQLLSEVRGA